MKGKIAKITFQEGPLFFRKSCQSRCQFNASPTSTYSNILIGVDDYRLVRVGNVKDEVLLRLKQIISNRYVL